MPGASQAIAPTAAPTRPARTSTGQGSAPAMARVGRSARLYAIMTNAVSAKATGTETRPLQDVQRGHREIRCVAEELATRQSLLPCGERGDGHPRPTAAPALQHEMAPAGGALKAVASPTPAPAAGTRASGQPRRTPGGAPPRGSPHLHRVGPSRPRARPAPRHQAARQRTSATAGTRQHHGRQAGLQFRLDVGIPLPNACGANRRTSHAASAVAPAHDGQEGRNPGAPFRCAMPGRRAARRPPQQLPEHRTTRRSGHQRWRRPASSRRDP
jgi:hypothetical protein